MREYIFRGRNIYNGNWVYGFLLVPIEGATFIRWYDAGHRRVIRNAQVDPRTVGQYTWLKDKNGVKIFEGDIVVCNRQINDVFDKTTFLVGEISPVSGLIGKSLSGNEICGDEWEFAEVIGNIHDNPELLKEGGKNENLCM